MADTNSTTATIEPAPSSPATNTETSGFPTFGGGGAPPPSSTEATIRAKFAELSGKTAPTPAAAPTEHAAPARGPDGKFASKPQENTQAQKPVDAAAENPLAATQDVEATAREERALTALRRAKVPKSILDGLDHATRIQWGSDLAAEQTKTDKMLRSRGADTETRSDPKAGTPAQADPAQGTPQVAADLSVLSAKLAETLALDEDGRKLFESALVATRAPLLAEIAATKQAATETDEMVSALIASNVRTQLQTEIPELADKAVWDRVKTRATRLMDTDAYEAIEDPMDRVTECIRDASSIECRAAINARAKEGIQNRNERRVGSQPVLGEKRNDPAATIGDNPLTYAGALLRSGKTALEARSLVTQRFG